MTMPEVTRLVEEAFGRFLDTMMMMIRLSVN